jgi:hypothetical protein
VIHPAHIEFAFCVTTAILTVASGCYIRLWLIDMLNVRRRALKTTLRFLAICLFGVGCSFGWLKYDGYRAENQRAAEASVRKAKVRDCITRNSKQSDAIVVKTAVQTSCEADPDVTGISDYVSAVKNPASPEQR